MSFLQADLDEFDRLVNLMDSRRQMERIEGRLEWEKFSKRFDKPTLDAMWKEIKSREKK